MDSSDYPDLVRIGGLVTCDDGAQLSIAWAEDLSIEDRAAALARVRSTRAPAVRRPRHSPARGRAAIERAGARAIAADDALPKTKAARYLVRVYYRSAGGDVLCFDAGPMSEERARGLHDALRERPVWNPSYTRWNGEPSHLPAPAPQGALALGAELRLASCSPGDVIAPDHAPGLALFSGRAGARFVVLPSQASSPIVRRADVAA